MSKLNITDEKWMRFLAGNVSEEESAAIIRQMAEDDALMEEYMAVMGASKLVDTPSQEPPDMAKAEAQIVQALPKSSVPMLTQGRKHKRLYWAAALLTLLVGTTVFFVTRYGDDANRLAETGRKQRPRLNSVNVSESKVSMRQNNGSENTERLNESVTEHDVGVQSSPSGEWHTLQLEEKHYAESLVANELTMIKPNKESYAVLCKNLDKSFSFQWKTANMKSLHFEVKDIRGNVVAETKDANADGYDMKYRMAYPANQLVWRLNVTYQDGSKESRTGKINVDYQIQ